MALGEKLTVQKKFPFTFTADPETIFDIVYPGQAREALYWQEIGSLQPGVAGASKQPEVLTGKRVERVHEFLVDSVKLIHSPDGKEKLEGDKAIGLFLRKMRWQHLQTLCSAVIYGSGTDTEAEAQLEKELEETETKNASS